MVDRSVESPQSLAITQEGPLSMLSGRLIGVDHNY
jgi:hypothetical protein